MMGREVRMVPADWQHPKNDKGDYIPLYDDGFAQADAEWNDGYAKWQEGLVERYGEKGKEWRSITDEGPRWTDWHGQRPSPDDYMPDWPQEKRTHLMMYEDTSEGTPISPAFATAEELARWLADNNASAFGRDGATYEQWLAMAKRGWAPSMVVSGGVVQSGVEFGL